LGFGVCLIKKFPEHGDFKITMFWVLINSRTQAPNSINPPQKFNFFPHQASIGSIWQAGQRFGLAARAPPADRLPRIQIPFFP